MRKLIMLDYDGTIVDSFEYFFRACEQCFNRFGFPKYAHRDCIVAFHDTNWFDALAAAGVPAYVSEAIEETYAAEVSIGTGPQPFAGICEVLRELGSEHAVVVITAARGRVVEAFLVEHRFRPPRRSSARLRC